LATLVEVSGKENPYLNLLYSERNKGTLRFEKWPGIRFRWFLRRKVRDDVLHLHWPSYYYSGPRRLRFVWRIMVHSLFLLLVRLRGTKVIWTMHNLYPHDMKYQRLEWVGRVATLAFTNAVIAHDEKMLEAVRREFVFRRPGFVLPLMSYVGEYPDEVTKDAARKRLQISDDAFVYLAFGWVRPYKGIELILEAFRRVRRPGDRLIIAGDPIPKSYGKQLDQMIGTDSQVIRMFQFIPHSDVQVLFKASNVAVLASAERFNSAAAMLALSFGRPILAPSKCVPPSIETGVAAFIYDPDSPGELERAMREAPSKFVEDRADDIRRTIADRSPEAIAERFISILQKVCGRSTEDNAK